MKFVDAKRFIEVWYTSRNIAEVAEKLKISRQSVHTKIAYLKKQGVVLEKKAARDSLTAKDIEILKKLNEKMKANHNNEQPKPE